MGRSTTEAKFQLTILNFRWYARARVWNARQSPNCWTTRSWTEAITEAVTKYKYKWTKEKHDKW